MKASSNMDKRLRMFAGEMYSACQTGTWCFNRERNVFYSTYPFSDDLRNVLEVNGILQTVVSDQEQPPRPKVLSDNLDLIWIYERADLENGGTLFFMVGPVFLMRLTQETLMKKLAQLTLSVAKRMKFTRILAEAPVVNIMFIEAVSRMLHFAIYDEYLGATEVYVGQRLSDADEEHSDTKDAEVKMETWQERMQNSLLQKPDRSQAEMREYAHLQELLLQAVRTGTRDAQEAGSVSTGGFHELFRQDSLRSIKDSLLIFQGLCTQAARDGGLPLEEALELEQRGVEAIERATDIAEAARQNWDNYEAFIDAVRQTKQEAQQGISVPIQLTMEYIRQSYRKDIALADLARNVGYTEYYLSRKFTKETGWRIQDYLREVRLEAARVQLLTTRKDIDAISSELRFKSRSHFDRTFKEKTGMTPAVFRKTMGQGTGQTKKS